MSTAKTRDPALEKAIEEAGGPAALAQFITENYGAITAQAICDWTACPPRRVLQVEAAVKAKGGKSRRSDICPDLYPPRQKQKSPA